MNRSARASSDMVGWKPLHPGRAREDPGVGRKRSGCIRLLARRRPICHSPFMKHMLTAILTREDDGFVALCPELDVASQGATVEEAKANLKEAVELFFECASEEEVRQRMASESYISTLEVQVA